MQQNSDSKKDVFEMILSQVGQSPSVVASAQASTSIPEDWHSQQQEGQLAVDVLDNNDEIIVVSTMAGAISEQLEVYVHNDLLTIRGQRPSPVDAAPLAEYIHSECFWGVFSRTVVLPVDVKGDLARAEYKNGVLIVRIPKAQCESRVPVTIVDE